MGQNEGRDPGRLRSRCGLGGNRRVLKLALGHFLGQLAVRLELGDGFRDILAEQAERCLPSQQGFRHVGHADRDLILGHLLGRLAHEAGNLLRRAVLGQQHSDLSLQPSFRYRVAEEDPFGSRS